MATKPTAWGSTHVFITKNPVTDTTEFPNISTDFDYIGTLLSDSLTYEVTDGDNVELKDVNGILVDKLTKEPTYKLNFKIIKPLDADYSKFWQTDTTEIPTGTSEKVSAVAVSSFVCSDNYAIVMANVNSVGSDVMAIGKCSFTAKLTWSASEGYGVECAAEFLQADSKHILNVFPLDETLANTLKFLIDARG